MVRNAGASPTGADSERFSAPLTPGRQDGFGERWLTVDVTDASPVELLRLRNELASAPGFEDALRDRIARLKGFSNASFALVRELHSGPPLTVVTARITGQRLPELIGKLPKAKRPAFVARLLQKTTAALASLEAVAPDVTHAAITADRLLVTPQGNVCVTDHVFGSALRELALWPEELFLQLGLLAPADEDGQAALDSRTTVMQLAAVALSILLERSITLDDFEQRLRALVDAGTKPESSSPLTAPLRTWFERALQLDDASYRSAADAEAGLRNVLAAAGPAVSAEIDAAPFGAPTPRLVERAEDKRAGAAAPSTVPAATPAMTPQTARTSPARSGLAASARRLVMPLYVLWIAAALAGVAIGEGAYIAWLATRPSSLPPITPAVLLESPQPGIRVTVDGKPVGATPLQINVTAQTHSIRVEPTDIQVPAPPVTAAPTRPEPDRTAVELEQAAARQRSGGVTFVAPITLSVLEGDRVLGSTADGTIVASAGSHTLDLVNAALGYRVRQVVTIRSGSIARVNITPPMGRISVNAQPWAEVLIDDQPIGQTPLANVQTPIGEHQVTFRHPQFGERRERVTVRADAPARVSTVFQR